MREFHCRDAGFDCDAVVRGESDEEVLDQVGHHAQDVHHVEVTSDMRDQLAGSVRTV
jgi:predicted small metal-binding protein